MIEPGLWRNWKGHYMLVLPGTAYNSETAEDMVKYLELTDRHGRVNAYPREWSRPERMWTDHINKDGYEGPRFTKIKSNDLIIARPLG